MKKLLKRALIKGFRWRLNNPVPWTGAANVSCKNDILALFPEVELIHDHKNNRVDVYRVIHKGANPGLDILIHEFKCQVPPGPWLIEHMARHDSYLTLGIDKNKRYENWEKRDDSYLKSQADKEKGEHQNMLDYLDQAARDKGKKRVIGILQSRPKVRTFI